MAGWAAPISCLYAGGGGAAAVVHAYHGRHTNLTTAVARVYGGRRHAAEKAECGAVQDGMCRCTGWNVGMCRPECRNVQDRKRKGVGRKYGSIIAFSFQLAHVSGNTGEDKQHGQQKQGIVVCEPEDIQHSHQQYARIDARQARGICQTFEKALAGGSKPM